MLTLLASNNDITVEKLVEKAYFSISKNTRLLACTHESLLTSVAQAAILAIDCTGTLGQGYLVPFGKECVFVVGYQGLIELARRSGHVSRIEARPVYENDEFEIIFGSDQIIRHVPNLTAKPGKLVCAYAIAEIKGAGKQIEIMRADEMNLIRDRSPSKGQGPWTTDYSEMCRKTVVRRLIKYIPKSPDLIRGVNYDDGNLDFEDPRKVKQIESTVKPVAERIKDELANKGKPKAATKSPKKSKTKKDESPQPSAEPESAQPDQAPVEEESAGSDEVDPAPSEAPREGDDAVGYVCVCGEKFLEPDEGKCPNCMGKKFKKV